MSKKHVLIVLGMPLEYSTSVTFQNRQLIRGFSKLGFLVDVVQPRPSELSNFYDETLKDIYSYVRQVHFFEFSALYKLSVKATKTASVNDRPAEMPSPRAFKLSGPNLKSSLRKLILRVYFSLDTDGSLQFRRRVPKSLNVLTMSDYDFVVSSSDPVFAHVMAQKILRKFWKVNGRRPVWIQYWGDPLFTSLKSTKNWYKKMKALFEETLLLKHADLLVYASPFTLGEQRRAFSRYSAKMTFANQCAELHENVTFEDSKGQNTGRLRVGYFGDYMSFNRNIIPLYEVSKCFPEVDFFIVGGSDLKLEDRENVKIVNKRLPHAQIRELELGCDILFAVTNKVGSAIPAKIYYWSGFKTKPIIVAVDGPYKTYLSHYFRKFQRYIVCENTLAGISEAIDKAMKLVRTKREFKIPPELSEENMVRRILSSVGA